MRVSSNLRTIFCIVVIFGVVVLVSSTITETSDTVTYLEAWNNLLNGKIDSKRTPLYPIFLGFSKSVFGNSVYKYASVIMQFAVFILSVGVFHRLARIFTNSNAVSFWLTLCYSLFCLGWCTCLLTESFAISGVIFLAYSVYKLLNCYRLKWAITSALLVTMLIFLRPAFVYLLPALGLVWMITAFHANHRKSAVAGLLGLLASSLLLISYVYVFHQTYGVYALTRISAVNQWYVARQYGVIDPNVIDNPELRSLMKESIELHGVMYEGSFDKVYDEALTNEKGYVFDNFDLPTIKQALNASIMNHPSECVKSILDRTSRASRGNGIATYGQGTINVLTSQLASFISMANIYLLLLVYGILLLRWLYVRRKVAWFSSTLFILAISNLALVLVGAQAEWSRLFAPSYPLVFLFVGQICCLLQPASLRDSSVEWP